MQRECATGKRNRLIGEAERITHAAVSGDGQRLQGFGFRLDPLGAQNAGQPFTDQRRRQTFEVELQATRQNRDRQLLRIGGREQKTDMRRRLFQRLQQGIEGMLREHVHLIDQVHLVTAARGRVLHVVEQLAGVVDLGARGRIDFDQINKAPLVDLLAGAAAAAGSGGHTGFAVQAFRDDPTQRGFANAPGAGEQHGVVNALLLKRIAQGLDHVLLARHLLESAWAPFARQCLIGHAEELLSARCGLSQIPIRGVC